MSQPLRRVVLLLALALAAAAAAIASLRIPYRGFQGETFVQFNRGARTPAIARTLQQAGVIRYQWQFWLARALHPSTTLEAGEYRFVEPASVETVFDRIARGDVFYIELKIPEGSNIFDVARLVGATGTISAAEFATAAVNPAPIRDLDPQAKSLEGYLFPAAYKLSHSTTAQELCEMMTAQFRRHWKDLGGGDLHLAVTLASLVEKETGITEERPLVASVFVNRLARGMYLACDPTTIYAALLEDRYEGSIHRWDLHSDNPYNTYRHSGLPPGPIANPGVESLQAAIHPAQTNYLYFVALRSGPGHRFSATLAEHEKAVADYRHGESSPKKAIEAPRHGESPAKKGKSAKRARKSA
jgi:UPF0755 protein